MEEWRRGRRAVAGGLHLAMGQDARRARARCVIKFVENRQLRNMNGGEITGKSHFRVHEVKVFVCRQTPYDLPRPSPPPHPPLSPQVL